MRKRRAGILLVLACLLPAGTWAARLVTDVIPLNYRPATELVPILQPLVPAPGSVSGMLDQLIIRTSADNLAAVKEVLASPLSLSDLS